MPEKRVTANWRESALINPRKYSRYSRFFRDDLSFWWLIFLLFSRVSALTRCSKVDPAHAR